MFYKFLTFSFAYFFKILYLTAETNFRLSLNSLNISAAPACVEVLETIKTPVNLSISDLAVECFAYFLELPAAIAVKRNSLQLK